MKIKLLICVLLFSFVSTMANEPREILVVWAKDGSQMAYALAEKPKVSFTANDLVITTNGVDVNYPLEELARFTYEYNQTTSITNLQTNESLFILNDETLLFPALRTNSTVSVFSLNGMLIFKKTIREDGEYAFPLSNLNAGVYMVNVNGLTYKIVKK